MQMSLYMYQQALQSSYSAIASEKRNSLRAKEGMGWRVKPRSLNNPYASNEPYRGWKASMKTRGMKKVLVKELWTLSLQPTNKSCQS